MPLTDEERAELLAETATGKAKRRMAQWRGKMTPDEKKEYRKRSNAHRLRTQERLAGRPRPDVCEICEQQGVIYFDHDHQEGSFRGWICRSCNLILGLSNDDPKVLEKIITYLMRGK